MGQSNKKTLIQLYMDANPGASITETARQTGASRAMVSIVRGELKAADPDQLPPARSVPQGFDSAEPTETFAETLAKGRGQQAKFADLVGITRQLTNNYIGPNPTKRIGDEMARSIEEAFDRRRGWLDERHDDERLRLTRRHGGVEAPSKFGEEPLLRLIVPVGLFHRAAPAID